MVRDCLRCGATLPIDRFAITSTGHFQMCRDCWAVNSVVLRVAGIAADGIVRLRAIDSLLALGYIRAARLIAAGATDWPSIPEIREGAIMARQRLWWISLDAGTMILLRMLLQTPHPRRTPLRIPAA